MKRYSTSSYALLTFLLCVNVSLFCSTASTAGPLPSVKTIRLPHVIKGIKWNPQGDLLAVHVAKDFMDDGIIIFDGEERRIELSIPKTKIADMAWSPDGSLAIAMYSIAPRAVYNANAVHIFKRSDILASDTNRTASTVVSLGQTRYEMYTVSFLNDTTIAVGYGPRSYYRRQNPALQIINTDGTNPPTVSSISIASIAEYFKEQLGLEEMPKNFLGIYSIVMKNGLLATEGYLFKNENNRFQHPLEMLWHIDESLQFKIAQDHMQPIELWNSTIAAILPCPRTGLTLYKHAGKSKQIHSRLDAYDTQSQLISSRTIVTLYAIRPNGQLIVASVNKYTLSDRYRFGSLIQPWRFLPFTRITDEDALEEDAYLTASDQETTFAYEKTIYSTAEKVTPPSILEQLRHRQLTGRFAPQLRSQARSLLKHQEVDADSSSDEDPVEEDADQTYPTYDIDTAQTILRDLPSSLGRRSRINDSDDHQDGRPAAELKRTCLSSPDDLEKI